MVNIEMTVVNVDQSVTISQKEAGTKMLFPEWLKIWK